MTAPLVQAPDSGEEPRWLLELEDVPESLLHDVIIELLKLVLKHRYRDRDAIVASNLACRWDPEDARVGVDPDVILVEPAPPEGEGLKSLRVWMPEHAPPKLAIEVVSETNAEKDYVEGPMRLGLLGAEELWIFDPDGYGPKTDGGPFVLQIFRAAESGEGPQMQSVHAGSAPAYSPALDAWVVTTDGGHRLRVADDPDGLQLWPTEAEAAAQAREAEVRAREAEVRARVASVEAHKAEVKARQEAEAEVRRLRALLSERS